jgi:hypothetical protein
MATAVFTEDLKAQLNANTIAVDNLDSFYLLVCGVFVFFMQVHAGAVYSSSAHASAQQGVLCILAPG